MTALRAGGRSALPLPEGQVLLARSCYLHPSWGHEAWAGPPAVRIRAAAEGREARRGAGKSPAPPAVGRWGRDLLPPARVSALGGYPPPSTSSSATSLPPPHRRMEKFVRPELESPHYSGWVFYKCKNNRSMMRGS